MFVHMILVLNAKICSSSQHAANSDLLNSNVSSRPCNRLHHTHTMLFLFVSFALASSEVNTEALNVKEHRGTCQKTAAPSSCVAQKREQKKRAIIKGSKRPSTADRLF